jgi:hypothetical protein
MTQYKGNGDPDYDEFVPKTPIVVTGRMFNPSFCIAKLHLDAGTEDADQNHVCVHDWRVYWGNQKRGG